MNWHCARTQTRKIHARFSSAALIDMIDFFVEKNGGGGSEKNHQDQTKTLIFLNQKWKTLIYSTPLILPTASTTNRLLTGTLYSKVALNTSFNLFKI